MNKMIDVALGILTEHRPIPTTHRPTTPANTSQSHAQQHVTPKEAHHPSQGHQIVSAATISAASLAPTTSTTATELRILIAKRPNSTVYGGYWELPGGKIEQGESPTQALVREFEEELGIIIVPGDPLDSVIHTYPHACVRLFPFFCTRISGEIQNLAVAEHQWVRPEALNSFKFPEANLPIIKQIHQILGYAAARTTSDTP